MTEAKDRLKQIEESALAVARSARELLLNEGWDGAEGQHTKYALVMNLLEEHGEMRLSRLARETGRQMKAVIQSVNILMRAGKVERVGRGTYRAVPKGQRLPNAEFSPPKPKKKRPPRKKKTIAQLFEET